MFMKVQIFENIMLTFVEKSIFRTRFDFFRRFSIALENTITLDRNNDDYFIDNVKEFTRLRRDDVKSLRVAIIGLPNVGKSTLINRLIHRHVCPTAARVHVTRAKTNAVLSHKDTQLVFIDTPGLVSAHEFKKFKMEESFRTDAIAAMTSADIVGVVQDASNKYTRGIIHDRILDLLRMCRVGVPSILILNKIDTMKRKRELLSLVRSLTSERGWPSFSDVFMVSALKADGINDLRNYLLDSAKLRDWDYEAEVITDQSPEKLVELTIRAKLMDCLPNEVPYKLQVNIEHFNTCNDGSLNCIVVVQCPSDRISKLVLGKGGCRIKTVALESEEQLSNAFRTTVRVKVAVKFTKERDNLIKFRGEKRKFV